jgi:hypothetical protein
MRSFAPAQFTIQHFGLWRAALWVLLAASAASLAAWWFALPGRPVDLSLLALAIAFVVLVALVWPLVNPAAVSLRWDARCWHLGPPGSVGREPFRGELSVAIDLGHWLLLRWHPAEGSTGRAPGWLPVQRRGLEPQWHALRCALYSPRPPAESAATHHV